MCTYDESRFSIPVVCTHCGGSVKQVNGTSHGLTERVVIIDCTQCRRSFSLTLLLRELRNPDAKRESDMAYYRRQKAKAGT